MNPIIEYIKANQFLATGVILGAVTTLFYSLKSIPVYIWGRIQRRFFYSLTIEQTDDLYAYLQRWLNTRYKSELRSVKASYKRIRTNNSYSPDSGTGRNEFIIPNELNILHYNDNFTIYYENRIITISNQKEKLDNASSIWNVYFDRFVISGLFAKSAIRKMLSEAIDESVAAEEKDPQEFTGMIHTASGNQEVRHRDLDKLVFNENVIKEFIADFRDFQNDQQFYVDHGIPYRRGYMLSGPPGTGKSSLASAMAKEFDMDIYSLNPRTLSGEEYFEQAINRVRPRGIILLEDADDMFNGREAKTKISFSTFINKISGVASKHGAVLIMTTNKKTELDEAMVRPGRIDRVVEIGLAGKEEVAKYLLLFYGKKVTIRDQISIAMSEVENICVMNRNNCEQAVHLLDMKIEKKTINPWDIRTGDVPFTLRKSMAE